MKRAWEEAEPGRAAKVCMCMYMCTGVMLLSCMYVGKTMCMYLCWICAPFPYEGKTLKLINLYSLHCLVAGIEEFKEFP